MDATSLLLAVRKPRSMNLACVFCAAAVGVAFGGLLAVRTVTGAWSMTLAVSLVGLVALQFYEIGRLTADSSKGGSA